MRRRGSEKESDATARGTRSERGNESEIKIMTAGPEIERGTGSWTEARRTTPLSAVDPGENTAKRIRQSPLTCT